MPSRKQEQRRLNDAEAFAAVDGRRSLPTLRLIVGPFEMHSPAGVFRTGATQQRPAGQLNGFVLDRTQDSVRQTLGCGPGLPAVRRSHDHSPPGPRIGSHFIEQQQGTLVDLMQHGVPAGKTFVGTVVLPAVGDFDRSRPAVRLATRRPRCPPTDLPLRSPPNQDATRPCGDSASVDA